MTTNETLDVTIIEPKLKHPTIFKKFDSLQEGDSFIIVNDHDPKPLYFQLMAERGEVFDWVYEEDGPDMWRVKISKKTPGFLHRSVGDFVAEDYRAAEVFRKYGIDFCCGGKKTIGEVCGKKQVDPNAVISDIRSLQTQPASESKNYNAWDVSFLMDYIVNVHHTYVSTAIPIITEYTQKVARVHGQNHPEVIEIAHLFQQVAQELNSHMAKEEGILFPYVRQLAAQRAQGITPDPAPFGTVQNPIRMMEHEHEFAGEVFKKIAELSNSYTPPQDACTTYKLAYLKLMEFEKDLHQHIHLENNILFPKSIELEE